VLSDIFETAVAVAGEQRFLFCGPAVALVGIGERSLLAAPNPRNLLRRN
jgi:hypothetical protein